MKKILILLVSISLFTACSEDDKSGAEGNILGTWFLVEANNIPGYTVNECTGQSNITFNADNTASSEFFTNTSAGDCDSSEDTGDWSSSSNSQYTFAVPQLGDVTGIVTFSNNGSRFTFTPVEFPASSLTFEK